MTKLLIVSLVVAFSLVSMASVFAAEEYLAGNAEAKNNSFNLGGGGQAQRPDDAGSWYHDGLKLQGK